MGSTNFDNKPRSYHQCSDIKRNLEWGLCWLPCILNRLPPTLLDFVLHWQSLHRVLPFGPIHITNTRCINTKIRSLFIVFHSSHLRLSSDDNPYGRRNHELPISNTTKMQPNELYNSLEPLVDDSNAAEEVLSLAFEEDMVRPPLTREYIDTSLY